MEPAKLIGYVRVSTTAQAESGIGLEAQRRALIDGARLMGVVLHGIEEDAGRSGSTMNRRPGLAAALAAVDQGEVQGLMVAKIDRLGRSSGDVLSLIERAQREGWRVVALDVGLDTTTPSGELVAAALAMAARFEWRRISERQREKHDVLRSLGRSRGRPSAPSWVGDRILELRDAGLTYRAIGASLTADGVPTARGAESWSPAAVRSAMNTRIRERTCQTGHASR